MNSFNTGQRNNFQRLSATFSWPYSDHDETPSFQITPIIRPARYYNHYLAPNESPVIFLFYNLGNPTTTFLRPTTAFLDSPVVIFTVILPRGTASGMSIIGLNLTLLSPCLVKSFSYSELFLPISQLTLSFTCLVVSVEQSCHERIRHV